MTRRSSTLAAIVTLVALGILLGWGWNNRSTQAMFITMGGTVFLCLLVLLFASGEAISPWRESLAKQRREDRKRTFAAAKQAEDDIVHDVSNRETFLY